MSEAVQDDVIKKALLEDERAKKARKAANAAQGKFSNDIEMLKLNPIAYPCVIVYFSQQIALIEFSHRLARPFQK